MIGSLIGILLSFLSSAFIFDLGIKHSFKIAIALAIGYLFCYFQNRNIEKKAEKDAAAAKEAIKRSWDRGYSAAINENSHNLTHNK